MPRAALDRSEPREPSALDLDHLARQTLGDKALAHEILILFLRQSALLLEKLERGHTPSVRRAAAHTLAGSARGIGAWRVAEAAERLERLVTESPARLGRRERADLVAALEEAGAAIREMIET